MGILMSKKIILLVDDNKEFLKLLEESLIESGYIVLTAPHGELALEKAKKNPPDLIISDILMPVMDGFTLCIQCKSDYILKNIPFVFYSGILNDEKDAQLAISVGADLYLAKPMQTNQLIQKIENLFQKQGNNNPQSIINFSEKDFVKDYNEILIQKLDSKILELERANEIIREQNFFFISILNTISESIVVLNKNAEIIKYNVAWEQFSIENKLDFSTPEKGKNFYEILKHAQYINPAYTIKLLQGISQVINNKLHGFEFEYPCKTPENEKWFLMRCNKINDESVVLININITHRKNAEEKLMLEEERLNSLIVLSQISGELSEKEIANFALEECVKLTHSKIGYFHIIHEDQENIELYTWSKDTLKSCTASYLNHYPLSKAGIWADSIRLKKPVVYNDYQKLKTRKGYPEGHSHLISHLSVPVVKNEKVKSIIGLGNKSDNYDDEDIRLVQLILSDVWKIIELRRERKKLEEIEKKYNILINNTKCKFFIKGKDFKYIFANRQYAELLNTDVNSICGKQDNEFFSDENAKNIRQFEQKIFDTRKSDSIKIEITNNSESKFLFIDATPLFEDDASIFGLFGRVQIS